MTHTTTPEPPADLGGWFNATVRCTDTERLFLTEQLVYELTKTTTQGDLDAAVDRVLGLREDLDAISAHALDGKPLNAVQEALAARLEEVRAAARALLGIDEVPRQEPPAMTGEEPVFVWILDLVGYDTRGGVAEVFSTKEKAKAAAPWVKEWEPDEKGGEREKLPDWDTLSDFWIITRQELI